MIRKGKWTILGLVIVALLVAISCAPASAPTPTPTPTPAPTPTPSPTPTPTPTPTTKPVSLKIGSTSASSGTFIYGESIAQVVNKYAQGVTMTHVETGATFDNLRRVMAGTLDMGTVSDLSGVNECYLGIGTFDKPYPKLRLFEAKDTFWYALAVRAELPIYKVEDLTGKQFGIGAAGSGAAVAMARVFADLGINVKNYLGSYTEIVNAMKDRRIAGYAKSAREDAVDATHQDLMSYMELRFLGFTDEQKKMVEAKDPLTAWIYVKAGQIKQLPKMPGFWADGGLSVSFGSSDIPQDVGYKIAKAMFEHKEVMISGYPLHAPYADPATNLALLVSVAKESPPLHAGLVQYYKEVGLDVPARLIPPEFKA